MTCRFRSTSLYFKPTLGAFHTKLLSQLDAAATTVAPGRDESPDLLAAATLHRAH